MRSIRASSERGPAAAACALLAASLLGCSSELPAPIPTAHPDSKEPRRGGTITVATFGDVRELDPANVADGLSPQIDEHIYAGLIDYDHDGKIVPDIAERWVIEDEGRTYRFFLKPGVRFHDGEEVTADDVVRSVERALRPPAPNPYATYYASVVGQVELSAGKAEHLAGVAAEGKYVVAFRLKQPDATFLPVMTMIPFRPVCRSGGTQYSDAFVPCGAGPFKLLPGGWDRGRQITLVRHEGYHRAGLPYLDAVRWMFHVTQFAQSFKFAAGEIDILRDFLVPDLLKYQADARWRPFAEYDTEKQIGGESMNVEMPPFDNVEIRRAVAAALDRDALRKVRATNLRAANQPIPPAVVGHDPTFEGQTYDYAAALEHMRRAGYPYDPVTKKGGWPHVIPYVAYKQGLAEYMAQVLAQQLEKIGIRIEIRIVNYPTFMALRGRRKTSAFGPGFWQQDYPEGASFLEPLFHSKSIAPEDANNWSFYANPRVDELVDRSRRELDDERRTAIYREAQRIVCDDAPWAFTYYFRWYGQRQPYVHDYRPHPMWIHDVKASWVDRLDRSPVGARAIFSGRALGSLLGAGGPR